RTRPPPALRRGLPGDAGAAGVPVFPAPGSDHLGVMPDLRRGADTHACRVPTHGDALGWTRCRLWSLAISRRDMLQLAQWHKAPPCASERSSDLESGHFQRSAPHGWGMLELARRAQLAPVGNCPLAATVVLQSPFSTVSGSNRAARRAGTYAATAVMAS